MARGTIYNLVSHSFLKIFDVSSDFTVSSTNRTDYHDIAEVVLNPHDPIVSLTLN